MSQRSAILIRAVCVVLVYVFTTGGTARAGEPEALAISANIQARHLPFGTMIDPIFASPESNDVVGYTRCGDSAIWTGHYLAAEAFRYKATQSAQALDNVRRAIAGIKSLMDVTGTNLLARCLLPVNSPYLTFVQAEEGHNGLYTNTSAGWVWVGNTSRDQYAGVMFGLAVAYDMVDTPDVKTSASEQVTRVLDFLRGHDWAVVMPSGIVSTIFQISPQEILSFLQVGRHVNPGRFSTAYDVQRVLTSAGVPAAIGIEILTDGSYSKFNLDYITLYNLVRLDSSFANVLYSQGYEILRNHTAGHQNAFFNTIDRALRGPDAARDQETASLLDQWLQRPRRDKIVDLHGTVAVCGDQACQPVPVPLRPPTDFLWQRSPFQLQAGGEGTFETAGIDYILPYWMMRYYAATSRLVAQSAAAASPAIAPESIASIYGTNLASTTQRAVGLPLPTSLGGTGVMVKDINGVERPASLIYVSPTQINLVLPKIAAPGQATFTISTATGQSSVSAMVLPVQPTLFSANATGSGTAAATGIRVNAANPRLQSPVPVFACDSLGCISVPIDVGVDTPVYLTFYGTGIRNRSSLSNVKVAIRGVDTPVLYAGPQPEFEGLDQVNVPLPLSLRGAGECNVVLTVDGQTANTVTINVK